jgi:hypothetical protein
MRPPLRLAFLGLGFIARVDRRHLGACGADIGCGYASRNLVNSVVLVGEDDRRKPRAVCSREPLTHRVIGQMRPERAIDGERLMDQFYTGVG